MKIIATVCNCQQVGMDEYRDFKTSMEIRPETTFSDLIKWYETLFPKGTFHIGKVSFSQIDEEKRL